MKMNPNKTLVGYQPKYFSHYYKFKKTLKDKWFELVIGDKEMNKDLLLNYIKSITWVEMVQPKLNVFQIHENATDKIQIRFSFAGTGEKYWVGRFKYSTDISIFLIENSREGSVELFFSEYLKNDYLSLIEIFNSGSLKKEINYFRRIS